MKFDVVVELKKEVLDAEGRAIRESLSRMGYRELKDVKVSRRFVLDIEEEDKDKAKKIAQNIAKEFLANPISETFSLEEFRK